MSSEMMSLSWVLALHLVMWIPYIFNVIMVRGLVDAVSYPENPAPMAPWAERMKAAHYNSVENLVVFAALVLMANANGIKTDKTVLACAIYFWAAPLNAWCNMPTVPSSPCIPAMPTSIVL